MLTHLNEGPYLKFPLFTAETGDFPNTLLRADVRVLSDGECKSTWGWRNILEQHICVIGEIHPLGSGSCNVSIHNVSIWGSFKLLKHSNHLTSLPHKKT